MAIEIAPLDPIVADARKRLRDQRTLWRFAAWGGTAALALAAVAITAQTESGAERLQLALTQESAPARAVVAEVAPRLAEKDAETQRLEAQLRALAADRDRLTARLASVEHNLDDVTGSIKRQAALAAALPQIPSTIPPASAPPAIAAVPAPVVVPPPKNEAAATRPDAPPPAATAAPDAIPLPPVRIASAPTNEPVAEPPPPAKIEFGIDLGGAPNVEALRARWAAVKANFGPLLNGLSPVAARDHRPGGTGYRLVVGPLPNTAAAARLCSQFSAVHIVCRSAKFDGERMAQR